MISQSNWLEFFYDVNGVAGFVYGDKQYFYRKDAQGNIIAILDNTGSVVVRYIYDAWGNHAVVDANGEDVTEGRKGIEGIGILNPFRYRGYYYDTETGLYYLQTRYYDPETGRFVSQDSLEYADPETINGLNLYAYCLNNPVSMVDPDGTKPKWWQWLLFAIGLALVVAAIVVLAVVPGGAAAAGLVGTVALGAAKGALIGAAAGTVVGIAGGAAYAGITGADMGESILSGFLIGFGIGAIVGAVIGGTVGYCSYSPSKISGFTEHGLNQVIQRNGHGVSNKALLETVKSPNNIIKQGVFYKSTYKFVGSNAVVILNKVGKVVTAWAKKSLWWRF